MSWIIVAFWALLVLAAPGCATRGSYQRLQAETGDLRVQLTELRRAQEDTGRELGRTVGDLKAVEARAAEVRTLIGAATAEIARLAGRLDTMEEEVRRVRTAPAVATPPAAPPAAPPLAPPRATREVGPADGAEQVYAAAMAMFRARELGQAVLDLLGFIAAHPKHRLAPNAQYWIGEAYYVQRDYRQALVEFQRVLEFGAGASKIPDALLKIGLCHLNLHDLARAQQVWQRVVREHPGTEAAVKAAALLKARAPARG
jgi:tol-pal system protein YbgF